MHISLEWLCKGAITGSKCRISLWFLWDYLLNLSQGAVRITLLLIKFCFFKMYIGLEYTSKDIQNVYPCPTKGWWGSPAAVWTWVSRTQKGSKSPATSFLKAGLGPKWWTHKLISGTRDTPGSSGGPLIVSEKHSGSGWAFGYPIL